MIKVGDVVVALAGKEKGGIYVVVKIEDKFAYLSDGKRLTKDKPKKKSFKHIRKITDECLTQAEVSDPNLRVNARLRKFLTKIRSEHV